MTEPLSGLELRKALCEALGWTWSNIDCREANLHGTPPKGYKSDMCAGAPCAPAYESDPAAFWPDFETWCAVNKWWWHFSGSMEHRRVECGMFRKAVPWRGAKPAPIETEGRGPCEAGARAWLAAIQSLKERR